MKKKSFDKGMNKLIKKGRSKQSAYNTMCGLARKNRRQKKRNYSQEKIDLSGLPKPIRIAILWMFGLYLTYALLPMMFELGMLTGLGFIVSCGISLYKGKAIKNPDLIPIIAIGYILTNTAISLVFPLVYENLISKSFLVAGIIFAVFASLYLRGKELKDMGTR